LGFNQDPKETCYNRMIMASIRVATKRIGTPSYGVSVT
jgi:hypothetical protein